MCFSAEASFGSAAVLVSIGTAAILLNKTKAHKMFVAMPFLFGIQQASEGAVWLTRDVPSSQTSNRLAVGTFLFFALVVWPSWSPWSIFQTETDKKRQKILKVLCLAGSLVSLSAIGLLIFGTSSASIVGKSISYSCLPFDDYIIPRYTLLGYLIPTALPLFVSSMRFARTTGYLSLASFVITFIVKREALISVWCFFSALISLFIAVHIFNKRKSEIAPA